MMVAAGNQFLGVTMNDAVTPRGYVSLVVVAVFGMLVLAV